MPSAASTPNSVQLNYSSTSKVSMAFLFVTPHTSGNLSSQTWAAASSLLPHIICIKGRSSSPVSIACLRAGVQGLRTTPRPEGLPHAARSGLSELSLSLSLACLLACLLAWGVSPLSLLCFAKGVRQQQSCYPALQGATSSIILTEEILHSTEPSSSPGHGRRFKPPGH